MKSTGLEGTADLHSTRPEANDGCGELITSKSGEEDF